MWRTPMKTIGTRDPKTVTVTKAILFNLHGRPRATCLDGYAEVTLPRVRCTEPDAARERMFDTLIASRLAALASQTV